MKDLLNTIILSLVDNPDEIFIDEIQEDSTTILQVKVAQSDIGKVIGKQGQIAKSIRAVVKSAGTFKNQKVIVKIL